MGQNSSTVSEDGIEEVAEKFENNAHLLPKEILFEIIMFLNLREISPFFLLSKQYQKLFEDETIWKMLLKRDHSIEYTKDEFSPLSAFEVFEMNSSRSSCIHRFFKNNRKENEEAYEEVDGEFIGEHWPNCMACDGNICAFSFERHDTYFVAFDCKTGKKIGSDGEKGKKSHSIAIHQGLLYVGVNMGIRVYQINDGLKYLKTFGGNTSVIPPPKNRRRPTQEERDLKEKLHNGHFGMVSHIGFNKDFVISGGSCGAVFTFKKDTHEAVGKKLIESGYVESMDCQGDYVALSSHTKVRVFDLGDRQEFGSFENDHHRVCFCGGYLFVYRDKDYADYPEFSLYTITPRKNNSKAKLVLKKKKKLSVGGDVFSRRVFTDSDPCVFGSGSMVSIVEKKKYDDPMRHLNTVRLFDVKSKAFQAGKWGNKEAEFCSVEVDASKYQGTDHEKVYCASFFGRYLFLGVGRFNFVRYKIKGT